jgi:hypothetical protein
MTAFAFHMTGDTGDRAVFTVASDSLGYAPDRRSVRPLGFIQKVLPLPRLPAVIFSRGQYEICVRAMTDLMHCANLRDASDAAEMLPEILRRATAVYCSAHGIPNGRSVLLSEIMLAGWSPSKRQMRLWQFQNHNGYQPHEATQWAGGLHAYPPVPDKFKPKLSSAQSLDAQLVAIVQGIGRCFEADPATWCGQHVGGEIRVTTVTPTGLSHRTVHKFASFEQDRAAAAAIVARFERGDVDATTVVRDGLVSADDVIDPATGKSRSGRRAA